MEYLGVPYPILRNPRGLLASTGSLNQIKSDLLVLLLTNPGERVMLPLYGTPLRELHFEPNDALLAQKAKQMIIDSIRAWEPRITIQQIEVYNMADQNSLSVDDLLQDLENILFIRISFYDPENIKELDELVLELPIGGN